MRFLPLLPLAMLSFGMTASASTHHTAAKKSGVVRRSPAHSTGKISSQRRSTAARTSSRSKGRARKGAVKTVSHAPGMDTERATAIQSALIKEGYMTGEPSGHWDSTSIAAMQKLQSDNGWQTKNVPDARALIKLGLGPQPAAPAPPPQP